MSANRIMAIVALGGLVIITTAGDNPAPVGGSVDPVCGSTACGNMAFELCVDGHCGPDSGYFCHAYTATLNGNPYPAYCQYAAQVPNKECGLMEPGEYGVNIEDEYYGCPWDNNECGGDCDFGDPRGQQNYLFPGRPIDECSDVDCGG
jgi:hypothetical protein